MKNNDMRETDRVSEAGSSTGRLNRRQALRRLGGAGLIMPLGLAGCVQQNDSQGGGSTDGAQNTQTSESDIGTVTVGILVPTSGPAGALGTAQEKGTELGVQYVNESEEFTFEIEPVYEDTETNPSTGRQKTRRIVEENGAQYIAGGLESSVALGIADYVAQQDIVYMSGAATVELTGSQCNQNTFRNETNAAQQMAGAVDYAAEELGTKWWLHTSDGAYGQSAINQIERRIEAQNLNVDIVGRTMPERGTSDFGPYISQISNSEAEVLMIPKTGGDLINFMTQADNAALKEEVEIMGTALFAQASRTALGQSAVGTYSSTLYNHKLETGDNPRFVKAYQDEYDDTPGSFARVGYELIRTAARGIQESGTADPTEVRSTLEGLQMTTVLGETSFRPCDHQAVNPVWTGEIIETETGTDVELLDRVTGEDAIRPCEETGCSL